MDHAHPNAASDEVVVNRFVFLNTCCCICPNDFKWQPMGVHVFMVQMRGPDLKPLPGIEMGDIGSKLGDKCYNRLFE